MIAGCFVAGGTGSFVAVAVVVAVAVGGAGAGDAESFGVHLWLIFPITITVLFSVLFFIFPNGAISSP